ncbi:protein of unknown function DUF187 [[Leptolyngbya] sp. PCC 7376]|uniref:glycoside hydrolase family 10 protein n=1 Tax=[Leptolyngbya] sp. PCC 7376 TaxID=111781 RepID=UPI00029F4168|nr:family 10 glycosylhydrolase [[Leptolyngbya] sp. PCC 7376]AFY39508.1 protein of unknown function DUF187 [[Leptolyngbya] sp. PCC 7376]
MGWQRLFKVNSFFLASLGICGITQGAIAQTWSETDIFPTNTYGTDFRLPERYQPIPQEYIRLGKQLEAMKYRWQSSQLTAQSQQSSAQSSADFQKSNTVTQQDFLNKVQRRIDAYYYFLEAREFSLAAAEATDIGQMIGAAYQNNAPTESAEIRAVWLDRGTIVDAQNEAGLAKVFDRFATAGINVVFMETVNASYPIFPSKVAPAQNPALNGWDALASGIKLAHARGMELHAWTWIFAAANQRHNEIMGQPRYYLGPVLSQNPDWGAGDRRGDPFQYRSRKAFFDPANPEVQKYLLDLLTEIATDYDVDGIQLDYIRYPFHEVIRNEAYGFGEAAREQFRMKGYRDPTYLRIGDRHWQEWQDFRIEQVDQFVAKASQTLKQKRPDLTLSAAIFAIPRAQRLEQIQQNWEAWIENDYLDMLVPMTYAETSPDLAALTENLLTSFPNRSTLLLPSIRLLDLDSGLALDQRQLLRQLPTVGNSFFAASDLNRDLVTKLGTTPAILPHREPLEAIAQRFQTLQQEWFISFTETPWQPTADTFLDNLQQTQRSFNQKNVLLTQSYWADFKVAFKPHLETYAKQNPYQAEVWQHRLDSIDQLLNYGDRQLSATN